jgi:thiol-disulfide isomerase/thioredoxin
MPQLTQLCPPLRAGLRARSLIIAVLAVFASLLSLAAAADIVDKPAPDFALRSMQGPSVRMSEHLGEVVIINFWATWCGPCRQEMPLLEDIYKKYKPMGFTLVGVNVEPDAKDAEAWLGKLSKPVTFPVAFDTDSKVSKMYKVAVMPSTVFVDRKGNIRVMHKGYKPGDEDFYLTQIRSMLKE